MHDARRRRRRLSWSADGGGSKYIRHCRGTRGGKWRVARTLVGKGEKRNREGDIGKRRGRETGTRHRWRRRYILAGSWFDRQFLARTRSTDIASIANTRICQRSRSSLEPWKKTVLRQKESIYLDSLCVWIFPYCRREITFNEKLLRSRAEVSCSWNCPRSG